MHKSNRIRLFACIGRFVAKSDSMLVLILRWFASLNTACKFLSVSRVRKAVLLIFIVDFCSCATKKLTETCLLHHN